MRRVPFRQPLHWGIAVFLWMCVIFAFSSMPGSPYPKSTSLGYFLERKGAHVFEYFVLTLLVFRFFRLLFPKEAFRTVMLLSAAFAFSYAATDELHQYLVPFRGASIRDVAIDTGGILLAVLAILFLRRFRAKKNPA